MIAFLGLLKMLTLAALVALLALLFAPPLYAAILGVGVLYVLLVATG